MRSSTSGSEAAVPGQAGTSRRIGENLPQVSLQADHGPLLQRCRISQGLAALAGQRFQEGIRSRP